MSEKIYVSISPAAGYILTLQRPAYGSLHQWVQLFKDQETTLCCPRMINVNVSYIKTFFTKVLFEYILCSNFAKISLAAVQL